MNFNKMYMATTNPDCLDYLGYVDRLDEKSAK